ncbi:MAG: Stp1/IreP family PP2C-type Ser/Thr phosphatase [Lachnospiraceae bacterium]|jgi:protein phosphatase|nr:Stp1/IreP family PP2C-type Ser/Thr phosphatase [Eubacterium sp.]MCI6795739.1 Stp1/IreP family PP2C-type Ser/Thr phosphatase [Lachnospiraceae bacterium]MDD6685748.1 Stp1/IreP family PP2C-type Ser/Thr phosphatase [Lachnospiraceae bacterium]MDD7047813.1 Stp1/IreP family PP2C-type Ser/Thr phosphatase [Lachnospiraceae bacterium]HBB61200.1 Stp1/IreP family PP2C-type Ser/Thr phosphatase [Lachnospiraceae bacterium]
MKVFSATDIGQKRKMNQDYIFTSQEPIGNLPNLFVVADGMGGHNAGDFASRYGVSVMVETVRRDKNFNPVKIMRNAMEAANREVLEQSREDPAMAGMGTTMVACTLVGGYAYVANVGDSRLYLANDTMTQISQDHSLIAEMVRLGELTPEEGRNHPDKNIITRAIGTADTVQVDFFDFRLNQDDQILMCSDGLSNMVEDARMFEILKDDSIEDKSEALIQEANANGGKDNIAVIVIRPYA